jgi:lysozyme
MPDYLRLWEGKRGADAHVKCIGVRGAYEPGGQNKLGIYDDDFVLCIGDTVTEWKGSTDPGQYYIDNPANPRGCAQLLEGTHMFKPGIHQGRWPAFVQAEDFHVNRLDPHGRTRFVDFGQFGIHLHSGGPGMNVDHFSAGCQVVWSPEGYFGETWHHFYDPALAAMRSAGQSLLPYMLVDQTELLSGSSRQARPRSAVAETRAMEESSPVIDTIIDINHDNEIDFQRAKDAGIIAIIHKASEGATLKDPRYAARKQRALTLGFKWGAYHFSSGRDAREQVDNFLGAEDGSDPNILLSLDFEPSSSGPDMTLDQAHEFVTQIQQRTGRYPVIYGGILIREALASGREDSILKNCPLWYVRYASSPIGIPTSTWPSYTLWQYTDGQAGEEPHGVPGVSGADRNRFQGTTEELLATWPFSVASAGVTRGMKAPSARVRGRTRKSRRSRSRKRT